MNTLIPRKLLHAWINRVVFKIKIIFPQFIVIWNYVLEEEILFRDIYENGNAFLGSSIAESITVNDTIEEETNIMFIEIFRNCIQGDLRH